LKNISKIISGTMNWGVWGKNLSEILMTELIEKSVSLGINTFDHADIYGGYTTEKSFGNALSLSKIDRESIFLISKCGIQYPSDKRPLKVKYYDYSKDHIRFSVENSLKNLKTDYLDVLLLHRPSPLMNPKEISEEIDKLKEEGKIKSFGVSNFTNSQIKFISKETKVLWNQIEFSLTNNHPMVDGTLDYLQENKIGVMAWSPLGSFFKEKNEKQKRITILFNELSEKYNCTHDQLLLAWILKHPANIYPVLGSTNPNRLKLAVNAIKINLEIDDWFLILKASDGKKVP
jgi:predicted oxidoreductase|tara:strand:+ start:548 stop:1414 length:867 start_codon:yes stop_codon:yes gene_type:complete